MKLLHLYLFGEDEIPRRMFIDIRATGKSYGFIRSTEMAVIGCRLFQEYSPEYIAGLSTRTYKLLCFFVGLLSSNEILTCMDIFPSNFSNNKEGISILMIRSLYKQKKCDIRV